MLASVARASEDYGTRASDIVRALSFSRASSAAAPNATLKWQGGGYPGQDIGLSVETYDSIIPWMYDLHLTVARGVPVIVLQQYWFDDPGGHYRVVVGFNNTHVFLKDPYDRFGMARDLVLENVQFVQLWRYAETPSSGPRYWGAAAAPWTIDSISTYKPNSRSYKTTVAYSYSSPFTGNVIPPKVNTALFTMLELQYDTIKFNVSKTATIDPRPLAGTQSSSVSFSSYCIATDEAECASSPVLVRASGLIQASTGASPTTESEVSPPYDYSDFIGSQWTKIILK